MARVWKKSSTKNCQSVPGTKNLKSCQIKVLENFLSSPLTLPILLNIKPYQKYTKNTKIAVFNFFPSKFGALPILQECPPIPLEMRFILGYWITLLAFSFFLVFHPYIDCYPSKAEGVKLIVGYWVTLGEEWNPSPILCLAVSCFSLPYAIGCEVDFRILAHVGVYRKEHKERPARRQKLTLKPGNDFSVNGWSSRGEE